MRTKMTYYFTYEIRATQTTELQRGGLVFKSSSIHPENFARLVLWPTVLKLNPQFTQAVYRSHEIHEWPYEDVTYTTLDLEDETSDIV